jgi:anti-sigma B factor antagonist
MTSLPSFSVQVRRHAETLVVTPQGELDISTTTELRLALRHRKDASVIVLDLRELTFMGCAGLHLVLEEHQRAQDDGLDFRLVRGRESVQCLFEITAAEDKLSWIDPEVLSVLTD